MFWMRTAVSLLLAVLYLLLIGGTTVGTPDFSGSPSYFDDDDDDFLSALLTEQAPILPAHPVAPLPVLAALAAALLLSPSARSLLAPIRSRLHAPPLP